MVPLCHEGGEGGRCCTTRVQTTNPYDRLFLALEDDGGVAFETEQVFGSDDNEEVVEEDVDGGLVE